MDYEDNAVDNKVDTEEVTKVLLNIQQQLARNDEDVDQTFLVDALQQHRSMILNYATLQFVKKPNNPKMLEAVTTLVAQLEKAVRDDRKERLKKKENEDNKVSFNQMLDAMKKISNGEINIPTFTMDSFMLDPSQSLLSIREGIKPINTEELEMGNQLVDLDGNPM
ncbi:hypothetical protein RISINGSUN_223 [Erwinia phage vB_EamM_RisingSun]|uniref:Uncharacterized protein n=1 Tax=Erwinia phage vB_EamM_RisingSun TaxID=2026080 RepID=A0A223LGA6_9CAUD|nr:hypothetical protein FDI45_gp223 [Erwinia phage vB_EamM_RisingSun]ASU03447.1 hypothetical protein RISINGSUN_223 [Erwinia phage vB_EamM_RisingSun]